MLLVEVLSLLLLFGCCVLIVLVGVCWCLLLVVCYALRVVCFLWCTVCRPFVVVIVRSCRRLVVLGLTLLFGGCRVLCVSVICRV